MTPDIVYDQLIGMGCARKLVFSWGGNPGVGSLHRFRDAVENGWPRPLELEEHSHAGMANRYVAGASGLPFAVLRGYAGTDLPRRAPPTWRPSTCPFTGERLTAVAALRPDVTIVHAQRADRGGDRAAVGHHRRAEGGRAGRPPLDRDGRGGRRRARRPAGRGRAAVVGRRPRWPRCRAAPRPATPTATRCGTTPPTRRGTRISRDRDTFRQWMQDHVTGRVPTTA